MMYIKQITRMIMLFLVPFVLNAVEMDKNSGNKLEELKNERMIVDKKAKYAQKEADRVLSIDWSLYKKFQAENEQYIHELEAIDQKIEEIEKMR